PDRSLFLRQVSFDFFMGHVNNLDPLFLSYLARRQITPQSFTASFGLVVSIPGIVCKPFPVVFEQFFDSYRQTIKKIKDILLNRAGEISELVLNHNGIDKRSYSKKNVPAWLEISRLELEKNGVNTLFKMTENGDALYKFAKTRIALKTKPGWVPPEHEFFNLCDQLSLFYEGFENNVIHLKLKFLAFFNTRLDAIKKTNGISFFDDLVNDLAQALEKEDAHHLKKAVRQTYAACLIDEFQDTDPRQYDIFSKIFSSQGTPFFMIGDPKQAIYAFRGGDIFAYLKASKESEQRFTLEKNYRSSPLLVKAINEIFSSRLNPFLYEAIEFSKVITPSTARNSLVDKQEGVPPLQFCFIQRDDQELDRQGFISKETAAGIIPKAVAKDIRLLLDAGKQLINKDSTILSPQKIGPQDIAVLVRTNLQAKQVQKALSDAKILSYLSKSGTVFDSRQAIDLHDILWAVIHPDNKGFVNAALCTSVFGYSSEKIAALDQNETQFFKWQDRFRAYREIWETKGFVCMVMALFHSDEAFLKTNFGLDERGLTNFYHLVELISQVSTQQQLSPYYLMKWYVRQLSGDLRDENADELRLESDKKAVAIVTIHKSKGLEYPIVYLPYLWEGQRQHSQENIVFHDPQKNHRLTLDLGSNDLENSQNQFEIEEKAEQRRLLYVALTRASAMCRIIWGGFKTIDTSALGSMLHPDGCKEDASMINDIQLLRSSAVQSILLQFHTRGSSPCCLDNTDSSVPCLSARKNSREIKPVWKLSSFSAITHLSHPEAVTDREMSDEKNRALITLAHFPKGAASGDFFHSIFETLDFTKGSEEISKKVHLTFDKFGFLDSDMIQLAGTSVKEVIGTRLADKPSGFCLKDIGPDQRFNEMEFIFNVHSFHISSVKNAFEQSNPKFATFGYVQKLSQLTAQSFKGFLKGFIDLVIHHNGKWYIVDYKSNYLGDTYDQYSQEAMFDAMSKHHYFLQYHLYLVALHRYLGLRLKHYDYDTHFGGVFYLFLRGMHPKFGSQYGVFFDRPTKTAVNCLSDNL
ncbi:MAG: exodeoxyribonuclease V subunit beta, partial [Proteobacteria bacterium]|nr:exodeoxyribonuclease V subunit beta [Pseudomonadota bacterium]